MKAPSTRVFLGCVAGALSILVFHQTTLQIFFWLGWAPMAAFRTAQVPPFHAPLVASITFWGAIYGGVFGLVLPWMKRPLWLNGVAAGLCAMMLSWFVFLPLMGHHAAFGWHALADPAVLRRVPDVGSRPEPRVADAASPPPGVLAEPLVRQSPFGLTPDRV